MLARGALCRPDLGAAVQALYGGEDNTDFGWQAVRHLLIEFLARNQALYDPRYAVNPVKQWLVYLKVYYPQAAALFAQVKRITDPEEMAMALRGEVGFARAA
jgi:tRNA-dihydrouridine synthase C